jgi:hypothetical protein
MQYVACVWYVACVCVCACVRSCVCACVRVCGIKDVACLLHIGYSMLLCVHGM